METKNVMDYALKWLSREGYSRKKMSEKLQKAGFSEEDIIQCLERLVGWGYLDDRKFGIRQIELLQSKLKSRNYTRFYLLNVGIVGEVVDELLDLYYPMALEIIIAEKFLKKKLNRKQRSKTQEWIFLARAGFDEDTVCKCFPDTYPT